MSRKSDLITHIRIHMNLVEGATPSVISDRTRGYYRRTIAQLEAELKELRAELAKKREAEEEAEVIATEKAERRGIGQ